MRRLISVALVLCIFGIGYLTGACSSGDRADAIGDFGDALAGGGGTEPISAVSGSGTIGAMRWASARARGTTTRGAAR